MRLRVSCGEGLAGWVPCDPDESITDLRARITTLFSLPAEVILLLLGALFQSFPRVHMLEMSSEFPLLDSTLAGTVLQSGDLIQVKLRGPSTHTLASQKPAASFSSSNNSSSSESESEEGLYQHPANGKVNGTLPASANAINGMPKPALPVTRKRSRASSTSSSSSSSSSSISSSSSSSSPSEKSAKRPRIVSPRVLLPPQSQVQTVAPGYGKDSTRARNARKRRKLRAIKAAARPARSETAILPSPEPAMPVLEAPRRDPTLTMFSLSNKNKRKGYKKGLETARVESDYDHLPANLVVSRVDVQAAGWEAGQRTVLHGSFASVTPSVSGSHWDDARDVELAFLASQPVTDPALLQAGEAIAVKVLELDSVTLSPAPRLFWGTLVAVDSEISAAPHLLPTAASSSPAATEVSWRISLKLHPACQSSLEADETEEDEELSTKRSIMLARRRTLAEEQMWANLEDRTFEWGDILAAVRCA